MMRFRSSLPKRWISPWLPAAGPALLLCLFYACQPSSEQPTEVRIGLIAPLSGSLFPSVGHAARNGARLAVLEVNGRGGLLLDGRRVPVVLIEGDDQNTPETSIHAARRLINQEDVIAFVGPMISQTAIAVAPVAEQTGTPMISPTATSPEVTAGKRFVFRTTFVDSHQGQAMARFARQHLNARRAAVLFDVASLHNRNLAQVFSQSFEDLGGSMVASEAYTTGSQDFEAELMRIRDAGPDVLLLPNYADEVPAQVKQARQLGIRATFLGSDAWNGDLFSRDLEFEGSHFTDDWQMGVQGLESAESRAFEQLYRETLGADPLSIAAVVYDAFGILFSVLETRGSQDGRAIRQGLAQLRDYRGVSGSLTFRGSGDPLKSIYIFEIRGGQVVFAQRILP